LAGSDFGIYNHDGAQVATGALPGSQWPGSTGLYVAEVELSAPSAEGLHTWSVKCAGSCAGPAHGEGSVTFGIRVVGKPDFVVRLEIVDKADHTPLRDARVVMHPYRTATDERGMAEMRVAKGAYKLFVAQARYRTFSLPLEVSADMTTQVELEIDPQPERN
jgi:hypothetical protein